MYEESYQMCIVKESTNKHMFNGSLAAVHLSIKKAFKRGRNHLLISLPRIPRHKKFQPSQSVSSAQWNILKAADTSCLEQTGHILSTLAFRLRRLINKSLLILVNCCDMRASHREHKYESKPNLSLHWGVVRSIGLADCGTQWPSV